MTLLLKDYQKSKYPFEEYLKMIHANQYRGLDDDMPDSFDDWIANLDCEELIEHANVFSKLLIETIT
jgi:hypothetical protein